VRTCEGEMLSELVSMSVRCRVGWWVCLWCVCVNNGRHDGTGTQ